MSMSDLQKVFRKILLGGCCLPLHPLGMSITGQRESPYPLPVHPPQQIKQQDAVSDDFLNAADFIPQRGSFHVLSDEGSRGETRTSVFIEGKKIHLPPNADTLPNADSSTHLLNVDTSTLPSSSNGDTTQEIKPLTPSQTAAWKKKMRAKLRSMKKSLLAMKERLENPKTVPKPIENCIRKANGKVRSSY